MCQRELGVHMVEFVEVQVKFVCFLLFNQRFAVFFYLSSGFLNTAFVVMKFVACYCVVLEN